MAKTTTKFSINDKVWIIDDNKPKNIKIQKIEIDSYGIYYRFWDINGTRAENAVFETKEELKNSL